LERRLTKQRSQRSFAEEVPRLLTERSLSARALAQAAGVDPGFLSRVLRGADYKSASPDLARSVAEALQLPADYFPEVRERAVVERIQGDAKLRDSLYDQLD
jgi:transcriptional regulator with XRE-family HTH domain